MGVIRATKHPGCLSVRRTSGIDYGLMGSKPTGAVGLRGPLRPEVSVSVACVAGTRVGARGETSFVNGVALPVDRRPIAGHRYTG